MKPRRFPIGLAIAGTTIAGGTFFFYDDVKFVLKAADRSLRVVRTLYANINEWVHLARVLVHANVNSAIATC